MATELDFSRAVVLDITIKQYCKFSAAITFSRDDSGAVDFTGQLTQFDIFQRFNETAIDTWTEALNKFSVSTNVVTFNALPDDGTHPYLPKGVYTYTYWDPTDLVMIAYGDFIVI